MTESENLDYITGLYAGKPPPVVMDLSDRFTEEILTLILKADPDFPWYRLRMTRWIIAERLTQLAGEVLHLEREAAVGEAFVREQAWFSGFGDACRTDCVCRRSEE